MAGGSISSNDATAQMHENAGKRKADDSGDGNPKVAGRIGQTHTRSKRNRYISIACNECKRRKIKCNGQTPCQRCGNLSLECVYAPNCCSSAMKDSEEFQRMRDQISSLQTQLNDLSSTISELRHLRQPDIFSATSGASDSIYGSDPIGALASPNSRTLPPLVGPLARRSLSKPFSSFHGPTSSNYGFDVAKSTLQTMGIMQGTNDDGGLSRDRSANASPLSSAPHPSKDPLWLIDRNESLRLCRLYEDEIGIMYPEIDMERITKHLTMLYNFIGAALRTGFAQPSLPGADAIDDEDTTMLKLVLAVALMLENNGKSELAERFFQSAKLAVNLKIVDALDIKSIHMMILTATYYFHKDEEAQAWRFIGIAARLCIEMGLHRKDSLVKNIDNEAEYLAAIRTFWVVYALDRRWSFGTGMPFALQDSDIDPFLPEPDEGVPYLKHITKYNKIVARVWYNNVAFETGAIHKSDEIGFLDYQILQWYQQLPESMKFDSSNLAHEMEIPGAGMRRLRFIMHLRKNQARISVYRPIFHSATSILDNRKHAQTAIDAAKDTIQSITGVNQISDMYKTQQVCYNYFLVQALAVIFLAVSHAPAEFCGQTRGEFDAAIDLIKTFNTKSHIARRLWRTVRSLKDMGDKIGLLARGQSAEGVVTTEAEDAHSSAAVAMAGLAGHNVDSLNGFAPINGGDSGLGYSPEDAAQLGNELSNLFELAGGYGNGHPNGGSVLDTTPGVDGYSAFGAVTGNGELGDSMVAMLGNEQEFSRLMGELF